MLLRQQTVHLGAEPNLLCLNNACLRETRNMSENRPASAITPPAACPSLLCPSRFLRLAKQVAKRCLPASVRRWLNWAVGRNRFASDYYSKLPRLRIGDQLDADSLRLMAQLFLSR